MAKGQQSKDQIIAKILETFPGSFQFDKELRIPMIENGEEVQIKVALTCAKANVERGSDIALPGDFPPPINAAVTQAPSAPIEPTADEKAAVAKLLASLNL